MDLQGKKIAFIGDSITEGYGTSAPEHIYCNVVAQRTGAQCFNYGISSTRIAPQHIIASSEPYETQYFATRIDSMIPDADMVVIFGGVNDFGHGDAALGQFGDTTEDTFYGAYHTLLAKLIERYPAAQLVVMTPLHCERENELYNAYGIRNAGPLSAYVRAIREVAESYGVVVADLFRDCPIQPRNPVHKARYTTDGLHPNDTGHQLVAQCLLNLLNYL